MNFLRKIVSGKRRRLQQDEFDLDMTYITPRIIAMSFPASGVETAYRNPIQSVAKFLREKHGYKFHVFNCSERTYDKMLFENQGSDYLWKDHHAPTLHLLFTMVKDMYVYLAKDKDNIAVVHCNSGKGRTGTAISTLLLYSGFVDNIDDALKYYGWKRFSSGIGVSQPCQLRTIYYFEAALKQFVVAPCAKKLKAIVFNSVPAFGNDSGCRPYFDINNNVDDNIIYTSRKDHIPGSPPLKYYIPNDQAMLFNFEDGKEPVLSGDVHFLFKHRGRLADSLICRVAFNTAFIGHQNNLIFKKNTISPDGSKKDPRLSDDLIIQFVFEDYCTQCNRPWEIPLEEFCEKCREEFKQDIVNWRAIQKAIASRPPKLTVEDGNQMHYRVKLDQETEKKDLLGEKFKLLFDSKNYKIQHHTYKEGAQAQDKKDNNDEEEEKSDMFQGFDYNNDHEDGQSSRGSFEVLRMGVDPEDVEWKEEQQDNEEKQASQQLE